MVLDKLAKKDIERFQTDGVKARIMQETQLVKGKNLEYCLQGITRLF